jgi:hypothetical protein
MFKKIILFTIIITVLLTITIWLSGPKVTIETEEQAKNYLSNTAWNLSTTVKFDSETFLFHDSKIHFSENAETCYEEFKLDSRLKGGGEWQVYDSAPLKFGKKRFFVDKFGKNTNEWYFEINTDCIKNGNASMILSIFLGSDGKLKYSTIYKGEKVTFNARKQ